MTRHRTAAGPLAAAAVLLASCSSPATDEATSTSAGVTVSETPSAVPSTAGGCDTGARDIAAELAVDGTVTLEAAFRSTAADVRAWQATPVTDDGGDVPVPQPSPQPWLADLPDDATVHVCTYGASGFAVTAVDGADPYTHATFLVADGDEPRPYRAWGDGGASGPPAPEDAEPLLP